MKSCMHLVGTIVWLATAIGCIHLGLVGLGYDLSLMLPLGEYSRFGLLALGAAGVTSLALFFMGGSCEWSSPMCNSTSKPSSNNSY